MAKHLEFKEHSATYKDADGDEHTHTVRAARVGKEHVRIKSVNGNGEEVTLPREVRTRTGVHRVNDGDVLVETEASGVYDVHPASVWSDLGYRDGSEGSASVPDPDDE